MARQRKRKTQPRSNVTFRLFRRHFDQFFLKKTVCKRFRDRKRLLINTEIVQPRTRSKPPRTRSKENTF